MRSIQMDGKFAMKGLLNNTRGLLAAFAIVAGSGTAALAQDNVATNNVETSISFQISANDPITAEEALERSNGQVLLHYGSDYEEFALQSHIDSLERMGFTVSAYPGGPDNMTNVYFFGNEIPKSYTYQDAGEMLALLESLGHKYKLIASNEIDTPEAG